MIEFAELLTTSRLEKAASKQLNLASCDFAAKVAYGYARSHCPNAVEDCVQESSCVALEVATRFVSDETLELERYKGYIAKSVRRACRDYICKSVTIKVPTRKYAEGVIFKREYGQMDKEVRDANYIEIRDMIDTRIKDSRIKKIVRLRLHGLSDREIALQLGLKSSERVRQLRSGLKTLFADLLNCEGLNNAARSH